MIIIIIIAKLIFWEKKNASCNGFVSTTEKTVTTGSFFYLRVVVLGKTKGIVNRNLYLLSKFKTWE